MGAAGLLVTERSGDLTDGLLFPAEEVADLAELMAGDLPETVDLAELTEGDLAYVELVGDFTVLMGDGRGFAGPGTGFVVDGDLDFGAAGFEAGNAFCGAEDVEDGEEVTFFDAPDPVSARFPPVAVSLNPNGLKAVPARGVEALDQSLTPFP